MTKKFVSVIEYFNYRSLSEAIAFAKRNNIDLDKIDIVCYDESDGWSDSYKTSGLKYQRLETDHEYNQRLRNEKSTQNAIEARDRAEYERLSKKYNS